MQGGKAFSDYLAQRSCVTEGEATEDAQLCTCLVKTVDFGSVHALFVFYSVIHFQQAIFAVALQFEIWFHDRFDLFDLFNLAFLDTALTRSTR